MRILTAEQMQSADRHAIEDVGMPALVLMENAGAEVVAAIEDALGGASSLSALVLCGTGNNGGDGMVIARRLHARGADVRALLLGDEDRLSRDAAHQWSLLQRLGVSAETCTEDDWAEERTRLESCDVVVDALLGTGFRGRLAGLLATVADDLNDADVPVVAVDVPSGLSGSSGSVNGPVVDATFTVTFAAPKACHVFAPAHEHCGDVVVADIGIPPESLAHAGSSLELVEDELVAALVEPLTSRAPAAHKGDFGHVLVVGGAVARPGAAALAGLGALAGGAGLVTVAAPAPCLPVIAAHAPELMHAPLPADDDGEADGAETDIAALLHRKSVVAMGPGLGTGPGATRLVLAVIEQARVPVVLDADALNVLAAHGLPEPVAERPLVITPHPGELARLLAAAGLPPAGDDAFERRDAAEALAARLDAVVVLKGFRTLVAAPRSVTHVNPTGGPGMATGGSGDVLTGLVAALCGQGLPPLAAAICGTFLHGRAGDLAEDERGQMSLVATDLVAFLPRAVASLAPGEDDAADA